MSELKKFTTADVPGYTKMINNKGQAQSKMQAFFRRRLNRVMVMMQAL